jgi:hypothetical protein
MNAVLNHGADAYTTMSIMSFGASTLPKPTQARFEEKKTNFVSDIDGAKSGPKYKLYFDKPLPQQSDVDGSTSKPLTKTRNCRDNSLYIDDIEGTRHTIKDRMMRTNRHVNPLDPQYKLPSYEASAYPTPRFLKDSMRLDDIHHVEERVYATRDIMNINDIVGAHADWRPRHREARLLAPPHDIMQVQDIAAKTSWMDKTSRCSNVLNPVYNIHGMEFKDSKFMRPTQPRNLMEDNSILQTQDIAGATPGWRKTLLPRREYRNTNYIGDIKGANSDSIKKGIVTKREVHPLTPVYQSLDPGELLLPLIPPLIPPPMVEIPTNKRRGGGNHASDYDPVAFTSDTTGFPQRGSSSGNQELNLDLSNKGLGYSSSMGSGGRGGQQTMYTSSGRNGSAPGGGFDASNTGGGYSGGRSNNGSGSGYQTMGFTTSKGYSPAPSARLTPKQKNVISARNAEIDSVRALQ